MVGLQSKSSKRFNSGIYGGMYSDREPGNVKVIRVKETPDVAHTSYFGKATQKLLDLEESMPDRWGHSGFKETYEDESDDESKSKHRNIVISNRISNTMSNRITDRLNSSIELSDDEIAFKSLSKKKIKLNSRVVVNKLKRYQKLSLRKIITTNESTGETMTTKKKSVVTVAPKINKVKIDKLRNSKSVKPVKPVKPVSTRVKKIVAKRTRIGTLQADLIIAQEKNRKSMKRAPSPKWGHDRFQEIDDDGEPVRKSAKSRLNVINVVDEGNDSDVSIRMKSKMRREIIQVKNKGSQMSKTENTDSDEPESVIETSVYVSDSDEWTEKEVINSLPRNDARRKLKQNKDGETEVNRVTLKNSIHEGKGKSIKSRLFLSTQQESRQINSNKESFNADERKVGSKIGRKRTISKEHGDSSFTDSSGDDKLYKKKVDVENKYLMRNRKFHQDNNRSKR